jgi:hypothetical protein
VARRFGSDDRRAREHRGDSAARRRRHRGPRGSTWAGATSTSGRTTRASTTISTGPSTRSASGSVS